MSFFIEQTLKRAEKLLSIGDDNEAEILYKSILYKYPNNLRAKKGLEILFSNHNGYNNLNLEHHISTIANHYSLNQLTAAIEISLDIINRGISNHIIFNLLGLCYQKQNKYDLALSAFEKSVSINLYFPEAYNNLGLLMKSVKKNSEAIKYFEQALQIDNKFIIALINLGNLYQETFDYKLAEKYYLASLKINPNLIKSFIGLGINYMNQKLYEFAEDHLQTALKISNDNPDAHFSMGKLYFELKNYKKSLFYYEQVLKINKGAYESLNNIGLIYILLEDYNNAKINFKKSLIVNPEFHDTWNNFGLLKLSIGDYEGAKNCHSKAEDIKPYYEKNLYNYAIVYREVNNFDKEIEYYDKVLKVNSQSKDANFNKAISLLKNENFEEGWQLYNSRWDVKLLGKKVLKPYCNFEFGKHYERLLIQGEQGIGDELLFSKIALDFVLFTNNLTISVDKRLIKILKNSNPNIEFIDRNQTINLNYYDGISSMGDLGQYVRKSEEDFLKNRSKLLIKNQLENEQLNKVFKKRKKPLVGISWYSSNKENGSKKNISLISLIESFVGVDCDIISLQYGDFEEEFRMIKGKYSIDIIDIKEVDKFYHIDELSFLIQKCDLVISTSNTNVHIAGALGKKVWLLLPFVNNWVWFKNRIDSLLYPNFKIFRQDFKRNWKEIIPKINNLLIKEFNK